MAKYHIELRAADRVWETLDVDMPNLEELRIEMARFVGELLRDHAKEIWADRDWRVDVTDESGLILYVMDLSASNMAAAIPLHR